VKLDWQRSLAVLLAAAGFTISAQSQPLVATSKPDSFARAATNHFTDNSPVITGLALTELLSPSYDPNPKVLACASGPITLSDSPLPITLQPSQATTAEKATLAERIQQLSPDQHLYLVLRDLNATEQPGILYHLYVQLPNGVRPSIHDLRHAGALNFFDAVLPRGDTFGTGGSRRFRSYDISAIAKELVAKNKMTDRMIITIIPAGVPAANARPVIGQIELVEQ
jgi:hypothetical protein